MHLLAENITMPKEKATRKTKAKAETGGKKKKGNMTLPDLLFRQTDSSRRSQCAQAWFVRIHVLRE